MNNSNLRPILHCFQNMADYWCTLFINLFNLSVQLWVSTGMPLFSALIRSEVINSGQRNLVLKDDDDSSSVSFINKLPELVNLNIKNYTQ